LFEQILFPGEQTPEQIWLTHAVSAQSLFVPQACPPTHRTEQLPPQSSSVSLPFFTSSSQVAATH
jgi:hypothetical protein